MIQLPKKHPRGAHSISAKVIFSLVAAALLAGPLCARGEDRTAPLARYQVLPGITAEIQADGGLVLVEDATGAVMLTAAVPALADARRVRRGARGPEILRDHLTEGVAGGQRGFSDGADDDGDGLVDEDRRDGRDNDGDGLVDEDFAAIGDDMTVVHRREGAASVHQESYHWSYPGLKSAVFLSVTSDRAEPAALGVAADGRAWVETEVPSLRHSPAGKAVVQGSHSFVTQVQTGPSGQEQPLWLAVMVLGERPGYLARGLDSFTELDFPLSERPLPLVVVAARSWGQLACLLGEAGQVYRGVADPLTNRSAAWIVPAPCSQCRTAGLPAFSLRGDGGQGLVLEMHLEPGQSALVDPDLFTLGGVALGSPREIVWRPAAGPAVKLTWTPVTMSALKDGLPPPATPWAQLESLTGHRAAGVVDFHFATEGKVRAATGTLAGMWLDGHGFRAEAAAPGKPAAEPLPVMGVALAEAIPAQTEDTRASLEAERHTPTLAPELLEGWPNPFRDQIRIRFQVPQTVGEAFQWVDGEAPKTLDPQAPVPWEGGSPNASVKIYSINGQELRTLYDGTAGQGEFTVSWNGTDIFGRQVASGTYFCKLQLDEWSVTRRLVYLR